MGCRLWGRTESDTTEATQQQQQQQQQQSYIGPIEAEMSALQDLYWACVEAHKYKPLIALPWREAPRRVVLEEVHNSVWGTQVTSDSFLNGRMGVSQFGPQGKGDTGNAQRDSLQRSCACGGSSGNTADIRRELLCHTADTIFRQQRCRLTSRSLISPNITSDLKEGHKIQNQVTNRTVLLKSNDWCSYKKREINDEAPYSIAYDKP